MPDPISIRMYEVGFGDCFLLGFHGAGEPRWVLVDCGSITEPRAQVDRVVDNILVTCRGTDGRCRLALVIATHRHKDHVGGFSDPRWAEVEVGEVWMPWTEDPADPRAGRIRKRQSALALALADGLEDPLSEEPANENAAAAHRRSLAALALNALSNEAAMETLHSGFAAGPPRRFLPEEGPPCQAREVAALPGVTFHVLGPPRDEVALALMDLPEGAGYLRWPIRIPRRRAGPPFPARYRHPSTVAPTAAGATFQLSDRKAVRKAVAEPSGFLGAALDRAVNNTSLVLMIEADGRHLLFPGDAQWGSWAAILADDRCRALLGRTTLLKVGHHGSHNATPRVLIEEIVRDPITALISVKPVRQWPNIPRPPLIESLSRRGDRIGRTDAEDQARTAGFTVEPGLYVECAC